MSKVEKERVIHEFPGGRPHLTVDEGGGLHHHHSTGAELPAPRIKVEVSAVVHAERRSSGPAKVASEAFRSNWDAIDWSKAN